MKKSGFILFIVTVLTCILLTSCGGNIGDSAKEFLDLKNGDAALDIDLKSGACISYMKGNSIEISDADDNYDYVDGELSIKGITLDDTIESVMKKLDVKPGFASFNYEYDPYGDGCTEIGDEIYDGNVVDMEKVSALDLSLQVAYYKDGDSWTPIDYTKHGLDDFADVIVINVTFNGVHELYGDTPGTVFMLDARLLHSD